jgi:hypothetical protein
MVSLYYLSRRGADVNEKQGRDQEELKCFRPVSPNAAQDFNGTRNRLIS